MKRCFYAIAVLFCTSFAQGQSRFVQQNNTESQFAVSLVMFTTLAAINAAGYDAGVDSALNVQYQLRGQIRNEIAKQTIECLPELREFYKNHKKPTEAADFGQYISFALVAGDAPKFNLPGVDVPPDVTPLQGLSELLARFYKEANIEALWNRSQPAYAAAISQYQDPLINELFETNGYLRNPSGYLGRRFQIYLDLLGAPDQFQVRSYRNDFFVVITPTNVPVVDQIRDAYLAYVLDPLTYKYSSVIKQKEVLAKYAMDAPALDLAYKDDFSLLLTKSLIKAIDSRLLHGGEDKRAAYVDDAMRQGFILTRALADQLVRYEHQPDSLKLFYPEMLAAIDVKRERKRIEGVQFAQSAPTRMIAPPAKMEINPVEESLENAEGLYEERNYAEAEKIFKGVLTQTTDKPMQGRAYYGLARIAVRNNDGKGAADYFQRAADDNPNPTLTAWSHVYLGRLLMASGEAAKAAGEFKLALNTDGASAMAKEAAEKALESSSDTGEKNE